MSFEKALEKRQGKCRGLGMFHPVKTSKIGDNLCCIRQKDVNLWFYRKHDVVLAIDTGYCDDENLQSNLQRLGISPQEISAVFLTHGDLENAGGLSSQTDFAPKATLYLNAKEEALLRGETCRLSSLFQKVQSPLCYEGDFIPLGHKEEVEISGIFVQAFHCPGHTKGHTAYLVDRRYLFTGDALALNQEGGQCYFHEFNEDTKENLQSLSQLKELLVGREPELVISSHNGYCDYEKGMSRISQVAKASKKAPFDPKAPLDVFSENA